MRNLKYMMLFEAFESAHLSKTLKFIKNGKEKFMSTLKSIADSIDIPLSKISDDCMGYLAYSKAIKLGTEKSISDCSACEGTGSTKRKWGRGFRTVSCGACAGSGKIEEIKEGTVYKFWLNKEGEYICSTVTDGAYLANEVDPERFENRIDLTGDIKDPDSSYDVTISNCVKAVAKHSLKEGDYILMKSEEYLSDLPKYETVGRLHIDSGGRDLYVVNDEYGSWISNGNKLRKIGKRMLSLNSNNMKNIDSLILLRGETKDVIYYNKLLSEGRFSRTSAISKQDLKDADFAITLSMSKLEKKGFKTRTEISQEREDAKMGATALMSDEDIRTTNIERYIEKMSDIDLKNGISGFLNRTVLFFGKENILYFISTEHNFSEYSEATDKIWEFLRTGDSRNIGYTMKKLIRGYREYTPDIDKRKKLAKAQAEEMEIEQRERLEKFFEKSEEVSKRICDAISKYRIESVQDMDSLIIKLKGMKEKMYDMNSKAREYYNGLIFSENRAINNIRYYAYSSDNIDDDLHILEQLAKIAESRF